MKNGASKKKIYNIIMAVGIAAIILAGVMFAGSVQGWFDDENANIAQSEDGAYVGNGVFVSQKTGYANIEREGIAYALEEGTAIKDGDILQILNGSNITLGVNGGTVKIDENTNVDVEISDSQTTLNLTSGQIFVDTDSDITVKTDLSDVTCQSGVFCVNARSGSANVYVFEGSTNLCKNGKGVNILNGEQNGFDLDINSFDEFTLQNIIDCGKQLCFTAQQAQDVLNARSSEISAENEQAQKLKEQERSEEEQVDAQRQANKEKLSGGKNASSSSSSSSSGANSGSSASSSGNKNNGSLGTVIEEEKTCTISIRCDTILNNMSDLKDGKNKYVPSNGVILATSEIDFDEGETVFDVLKRACSLAGIQLEYSWTPMYNSYYIEGINNLYEFDCGEESGWMYKVNGWFPNYGCSSYTLKDGDAIVFCYTCKGLGADVGGSVY